MLALSLIGFKRSVQLAYCVSMIEPKKQLGLRIGTLREKRGLSQRKFSLMIGINRSYLSDLERGQRNPSFNTLWKIAQGLDVTLESLFKDIG